MGSPLYDTNILIEHMRNGAESLKGSTTILNLIEFPKAVSLKDLDIIIPGKEDYDKGFEFSILLLKEGTPIPAIDVIVAAVAVNRGLVLHTKDKHFEWVQKISDKLQVRFE